MIPPSNTILVLVNVITVVEFLNEYFTLTLRGSTYFFVPKGSGGALLCPPKVSVKTVKEIIH